MPDTEARGESSLEGFTAPTEGDGGSSNPLRSAPAEPVEVTSRKSDLSRPTQEIYVHCELEQIYKTEIRTILDTRCQVCHDSMKELNFSSFSIVKAEAFRRLMWF